MKRIYVNVISVGLISVFVNLIQNLKAHTFIEYTCSPYGGRPNYAEHDLFSDGLDLRHISFLSFQVKCPCNAYILLQKDRGNYDNNVVEIVLGAYQNTYSLIRDKTDRKMDTLYKEEGIVCNTEFRHFWVSWDNKENGTVRVGKGDTEFINGFMIWSGLNHKLNYVSVGNGYDTGYWKFRHDSTILNMTTENSFGVMSANTISTDKAHTVPTMETEIGATVTPDSSHDTQNITSSFDSVSADKTNSMTAVYVSVPIVVVSFIGITLAAVLVLKRNRKIKEQGKALRKGIHQSKENIQQNSGVANKAFVNHSKKEDSGAQVSNIVSNQYAEIAEDNRKSVTPMYVNSNVQSKLNNVPNCGYGKSMRKQINTVEEETIYQNTFDESKVPVTNLYSNLDNDNSLLYLNVKASSARSSCKGKASVGKNTDNAYDPYYDHAKAGGHEWDDKDKHWNSDDKGSKKTLPNNENVYENTVFEQRYHSEGQSGTSGIEEDYGEECSNIPFYLELEEGHYYTNHDSKLIELEGEAPPELDYAPGNEIHDIKANENTKQQVNDNYIKANDYDRHYFILEKEHAIQEENTVYEGNLGHEYFILEKVDK